MTCTSVVAEPGTVLEPEQVRGCVEQALGALDQDGKSLCVLVPDATRSCPLPLLLDAVHAATAGRVLRTTVLVALGTHAPMTEAALAVHLGGRSSERSDDGGGGGSADVIARWPGTTVVQHAWWDPSTFARLGRVGDERVAELSGGLLTTGVDVRLNRAVVEHDLVLVLGPVFPHEVVGFSGGTKYLVPGVAAAEVIDATHWLGALITSREIIGTLGTTPVRAMIDEAAAMVPATVAAVCVVVDPGSGGLAAVAAGEPHEAWAAAAAVSARVHVRHLDAPVRRVLSLVPERYDDLWTGAKGFYKVEPVVADGGEVVLHAPHITRLSATHPEIEEIGYHCRDWFTRHWERYRDLPWGVLAHSTHLRGAGTVDAAGVEHPRVRVTLASGVPEDVVRRAGLGYLDPAEVDVAAHEADPDTLVVPHAGEVLHRLR